MSSASPGSSMSPLPGVQVGYHLIAKELETSAGVYVYRLKLGGEDAVCFVPHDDGTGCRSARDESVLWSQMGDSFSQIALKTLEIR